LEQCIEKILPGKLHRPCHVTCMLIASFSAVIAYSVYECYPYIM